MIISRRMELTGCRSENLIDVCQYLSPQTNLTFHNLLIEGLTTRSKRFCDFYVCQIQKNCYPRDTQARIQLCVYCIWSSMHWACAFKEHAWKLAYIHTILILLTRSRTWSFKKSKMKKKSVTWWNLDVTTVKRRNSGKDLVRKAAASIVTKKIDEYQSEQPKKLVERATLLMVCFSQSWNSSGSDQYWKRPREPLQKLPSVPLNLVAPAEYGTISQMLLEYKKSQNTREEMTQRQQAAAHQK